MKSAVKSLYLAQEFAERAGVTVRTLHHYDRTGLLKPSGYTAAGYRLYGEKDFARLQQIATLKFIGFSLKQIKELLDLRELDLKATLRMQRSVIEEERRRLEKIITAIERAERVVAAGETSDWEVFGKIIEVMNMQNNMDWLKKYYTEEQLEELAARGANGVRERGEQEWAVLIKEVEAAVSAGEDPSSEKSQALAERWANLIEAFTGGNPEIAANLKRLYADQANWPSTFQKPYSDEAQTFIAQAMAARTKS
ncbi:MAG TPA: MerR family transcriptional regulator [Pyrinomonadaceae bacterium]